MSGVFNAYDLSLPRFSGHFNSVGEYSTHEGTWETVVGHLAMNLSAKPFAA